MMMLFRPYIQIPIALLLLIIASSATAIRVATDIPPVHSLVAMVTMGVSEPDLIIQRGASPHSYSLRPSEAAALENADVIFWIGPELTPWLTDAVINLADGAQSVELLHELQNTEATTRLSFREAIHLDDHTAEIVDSHEGHDDHDNHASEKVDRHDAHDHASLDPHAWLDPVNARAWLAVIAETLASADPVNASEYTRNAEAAQQQITTLMDTTAETIKPVHERPYIVFHDAYQYFERRFDLNALGAIALSDARDPSASHIAAIQSLVIERDVHCVFAEPQFNPALVDTVLDGTPANTGVLDPLGSDIPIGPDFYPQLIRSLINGLMECLDPA
jgi:zinc transport system substrate-binding protein